MGISQRHIETLRYILQQVMQVDKDKLAIILERHSHEVYGETREIIGKNLNMNELQELKTFFMDELTDRISK